MAARHIHDPMPDGSSIAHGTASSVLDADDAPRRSRAMDRSQAHSSHAERAATWLSLACAVHCLVMPLAISVMPLLGASGVTHLGPTAEHAMTLLVVASALAGVVWGYRRHRDVRVVYATLVGLGAYLIGHAFEGSWYGLVIAVLGALTLAASSFSSARMSHAHSHDEACGH